MTTQSAISSNAFNAASFVNQGVDPRTGQFTVSVAFPELNGNYLSGPSLALSLGFNPINNQDSGYGIGWDLPLSQYNPTTQVLSTSTGETYKVTGSGATPAIAEQKLRTFNFYVESPSRYRVEHKSGLVEILEHRGAGASLMALPVQMYSSQGHVITLSYQTFGNYQMLQEVKQADGSLLLRITRASNNVEIKLLGGDANAVLAHYFLQMAGGRLQDLIMMGEENPRWRFEYETLRGFTCITSLRSPYGALETLEYLGTGHLYPGVSKPALPRVTKHVVAPGLGQPSIETRYEYSDHNFLGYDAPGLVYRDDHLDSLYRITEAYEYYSIQTRWHDGVPGRSVKSLYNRYHLLSEQVTHNGNALLTQATEYYIDETLGFDLQPPQCQLPRKVSKRWALLNDPTRLRDEAETSRFDGFGNLLEKINVSGTRETWSYYPAMGEPGCPPDPQGFTRQIKEYRLIPAIVPLPASRGRARRPTPIFRDEPTLISRFTYAIHPPLSGGIAPTLVLHTQVDSALTDAGEQIVLHSEHSYVDAPEDLARHGKPLTVVENRQGNLATTTLSYSLDDSPGTLTIKQHFIQELAQHNQAESHLSPRQIALASGQTELVRQVALYTGTTAQERTPEGQVIAYEYDRLQRLISETVMPGDALYSAVRRYRYKWTTAAGQSAEQWAVDPSGVETWTQTDGLGRVVRKSRQKADGSSDAQAFRLMYSAQYGDDMDLLQETHYDYLGSEPLALTDTYHYDEWDQCCRKIDSAGIASNSLNDPFSLTLTEWQDGMARTVTQTNDFAKPERVEVYGIDQRRVARQRSFYDGLGQLRRTLETGGQRSEYAYDSYGRTLRSVLPDQTCIDQHYASHSEAALVTRLEVTPGNRALPSIHAGTQQFDGLERLTQSSSGSRTTQYLFSGSRPVAESRITPAGQAIEYAYNLALSEAPTRISAEQPSSFEYHPVTAQLMLARSPEGTLEYQYDSYGQLTLERSTVDGQVREIRYRTSPGGRILQRIDFAGMATDYQYDAHGRLVQILEGQLQANFEYNAQGLRQRTTTQDLSTANTLVTELEYDDQGREILRVQRLGTSVEYRTALGWGPDRQLQQRELHVDGQLALREGFTYDLRGRLVEHCCSGPELPSDPYGNRINLQQFYFDGLDNLLYCVSQFADGRRDEACHRYAEDDPCQLRSVSHTHPDYPTEILLSYDANGNLLTDDAGRTLAYDRQGRLLNVAAPGGATLRRYRYDAHDHLFGATQGASTETLRFYEGEQLRTWTQGERQGSLSYDGDIPLGQQIQGQTEQTLLTVCGENHSVMAEVNGCGTPKRTQYTSHGAASEPLDSLLGYNGEVREADTGWYLLGKGYRAYNPLLRCFHSPDDESPFGVGGLNPYAYCLGNPIRLRDPTGHAAHPGAAEAKLKAERIKASWENAANSMFFGTLISGVIAGVTAIFSGGLSIGVFVLGEVELAGRTLAYQHIEEHDQDDTWIQVYDTFAMLQMLYLPTPKKLGGSRMIASHVDDAIPQPLFKGKYTPIAQRATTIDLPAPQHARTSAAPRASSLKQPSPESHYRANPGDISFGIPRVTNAGAPALFKSKVDQTVTSITSLSSATPSSKLLTTSVTSTADTNKVARKLLSNNFAEASELLTFFKIRKELGGRTVRTAMQKTRENLAALRTKAT